MNRRNMDLIHQSAVETLLSPVQSVIKCESTSRCAGCGGSIYDQYILHVAPDLEWHASCLKCEVCQQYLDESQHTCFVYRGRPICKDHYREYVRRFGIVCAKCNIPFSKEDSAMQVRNVFYHTGCFRCSVCDSVLTKGDEFCLKDDFLLLCKTHLDMLGKNPASHICENDRSQQSDRKRAKSFESVASPGSNDEHVVISGTRSPGSASPTSSSGTANNATALTIAVPNPKHTSRDSSHHRPGKHGKEAKTTRMRTVLNERQLTMLRQCYQQNPRPDALMKEHLVEMTSLNPRVIRVWFQNKRCKDKKRSILMKQMQQQEKNGQRLAAIQGMNGVSMVAGSPVRHVGDGHLQMNPVDIRNYHQSPPAWKALSDFAMQNDLRLPLNGAGNMSGDPGHEPAGAFQQLMNGFSDPCMNGMLPHMHEFSSHNGGMYDMAGEDSYPHAPNSVSSSTIPSDLSSPTGSTD